MNKFRPKFTRLERLYDPTDKEHNARVIIDYMLDRTQSMFHYENLPDTIPANILELFLQTRGHVCFTKTRLIDDDEEHYYIFVGGPGGEPDVYFRPTLYVVANPRLEKSLELKINEECVVIRNDEIMRGLLPIFSKYAALMVENELTMRIADINMRIPALLSADDDTAYNSAVEYLANIEKGKLGVIADSTFFEGIKTSDYGKINNGALTDLIEYEQYLKASLFNEIGLDANYNMKRESINSKEAQMNDDALIPLIDEMLICRQRAIERINKLFGLNITVELSSVWRATQEEIEQIIEEGVDDEPATDEEITEEAQEEQEETTGEENGGENEQEQEETEKEGSEDTDSNSEGNNEGTEKEEIDINININTEDKEKEDKEDDEKNAD